MVTKTLDAEVAAWVAGRLPDEWFVEPAAVALDRDEVLIVGQVPDVELEPGAADAALSAAREARIARFRADTRVQRMQIADELEQRTGRKVSWGARCGATEVLFTTVAVPVMTRLRLAERAVLDTLINGGVARSRSEALAWCVRLVGEHEADWMERLREALAEVRRIRSEGPAA